MSVMPGRNAESAIPHGEKRRVDSALEIQLATIKRSEMVDASAGGHGFMVPMDTRDPGIIVFQKGDYAGHYTLPDELAEKELPELLQTEYLKGILDKYKR